MARGYIYILFNASLRRNQFKIGLTTGTPENRARELSRATGVPQPYEVAYSVFVEDCAAAERIVHQHLAEHRINKEFFELPLAVAVRAVEDAAAKVGRANIDETPKESSAEITSVPAQATEFGNAREVYNEARYAVRWPDCYAGHER